VGLTSPAAFKCSGQGRCLSNVLHAPILEKTLCLRRSTGSHDPSVFLYRLNSCIFTSWLNTLYLSMDANFKLRQKERGLSDPPLSNGLAYMVADGKLKHHLAHCSNDGQIAEVSI
jgi:hypothetical protein